MLHVAVTSTKGILGARIKTKSCLLMLLCDVHYLLNIIKWWIVICNKYKLVHYPFLTIVSCSSVELPFSNWFCVSIWCITSLVRLRSWEEDLQVFHREGANNGRQNSSRSMSSQCFGPTRDPFALFSHFLRRLIVASTKNIALMLPRSMLSRQRMLRWCAPGPC